MIIRKISPVTGNEVARDIPLNSEDYFAWKEGLGSIEDLMPYLTTDDKDFILAGIMPGEWKKLLELEGKDDLFV